MKAILIAAAGRSIETVEGEANELMQKHVRTPRGILDLALPRSCMVCCPIGAIGDGVHLWWHFGYNDVYGGNALVFGLGEDGYPESVPPGTWLNTRRAVEFLGTGGAALLRLRTLMGEAMGSPVIVPPEVENEP